MKSLRKIILWVQGHRLLTTSMLIIIFVCCYLAASMYSRSKGKLSPPLKLQSIVSSVYGIGTVMASQSYQIKFGVVSRIIDLFIKEGDYVNKGARLINIEGTTYRAPFQGTITSLPYKIGENIFPQLPLLTLVNLSDRYLVITFEQQGALRVIKGQRAVLSFDSMRDQRYEGIVESVYSFNGNFLARINATHLPERILPDMTADVAITLLDKKDVLLLPIEALDHGKVWVKRNKSLAKLTEIKIGIVDGAFAEVLSGDLKVGDRVLIKPSPN